MTRCDVVRLSLRIDFFHSERCRTTCRSRRRYHAKLYCHAGKFWHDVASRRGALQQLASYCELGFIHVAIVVSYLLVFALMLTDTLLCDVFHTQFPQNYWLREAIFAPAPIIGIVGLGMFEANAIQFGLDQLHVLEAPTQNLISFIHWYYWSQNVARLVMFYMTRGGFVTVCGTDMHVTYTLP